MRELDNSAQKLRIKCDSLSPNPFYAQNIISGMPAQLVRGDETIFEIGLFRAGTILDSTAIAADKLNTLKLIIKAVTDRAERYPNPNGDILHLATATVDGSTLSSSVTSSTWADGTAQHAKFNIKLGNIQTGEVWIIVKGLSSTSGDESTFLTARAVVLESGSSSTLTATEAEIESISDGITEMKNAALSAIDTAQTAAVAQIDSTTTLSLVSLTDASSITLSQGNACYTLIAAQSSYAITVSATPSSTKLTQIMLQLKIGSTAPTISWGTEHFFKNQIPVINANACYDILYEYDNLRSFWVCGYIAK